MVKNCTIFRMAKTLPCSCFGMRVYKILFSAAVSIGIGKLAARAAIIHTPILWPIPMSKSPHKNENAAVPKMTFILFFGRRMILTSKPPTTPPKPIMPVTIPSTWSFCPLLSSSIGVKIFS